MKIISKLLGMVRVVIEGPEQTLAKRNEEHEKENMQEVNKDSIGICTSAQPQDSMVVKNK